MKKLNAILMAAALASSIFMAPAFADDETLTSSTNESAVEKGDFTTEHPVLSHTVTLPFRLVTGVVGATTGFIGGALKGVATGVQDGFTYANENGPEGDTITDRAGRGILYFPTAGVATVLFVPRNVVEGSLTNGWNYGKSGYQWWDRI